MREPDALCNSATDPGWHLTGLQALGGGVADEAQTANSGKAEVVDGLLTQETPIKRAIEVARPDRRAIVEQLCEALKIDTQKPASAVQQRLKRIRKQATSGEDEMRAAVATQMASTMALGQAVRAQWPEMVEHEYSPIVYRLTGELAEPFTRFIDEHPQADAWQQAQAQRQKVEAKMMKLAKREAKVHRLHWQLRSILLEANLPRVAPAEIAARYHDLLHQEEQPLATLPGSQSER